MVAGVSTSGYDTERSAAASLAVVRCIKLVACRDTNEVKLYYGGDIVRVEAQRPTDDALTR